MPKIIIVPVDGSDASVHALYTAIEMVKALGDQLKIINIQSSLKELGQMIIDEAAQIVQNEGVTFTTKIRTGIASIEIVSEAKEENTRYIVMPIGKGQAEALGSVSRRVLEMAPCPVLMVPEIDK